MSLDEEEEFIGGSTRRPLREKEFPDEANSDDEDDGTDPCPHCGAAIYIDGQWCPKCGKFLSKEDEPISTRSWIIAAVVIGLVVLMFLGFVLFR